MDEFQKRLKECRKEKGLTQKELAALLEISSTCYAGYEQGYREPDLKTLKKISLYFEVSTDYLLGLEQNSSIDISELNDTEIKIIYELIHHFSNMKK